MKTQKEKKGTTSRDSEFLLEKVYFFLRYYLNTYYPNNTYESEGDAEKNKIT